MAILNIQLQDYEIEPSELSLSVWEAPAFLEDNSIDPEDLHGEWTALDLYIRNDCETALTFERVADWIAEGELSDGELRDLSFRIAREFVSRLDNVRQCADRYLDTTRQQADRIRELECYKPADPDTRIA